MAQGRSAAHQGGGAEHRVGPRHGEAVAGEDVREEVLDVGVVLDHQHPAPRRDLPCCPTPARLRLASVHLTLPHPARVALALVHGSPSPLL